DATATRSDALNRVLQEFIGSRTLPLHVAGRKMRADIAVGKRAEDGIDQRMEADIAVGMGEESSGVRHAHAANHQMVAVAESMNVVTGAAPDIAEKACETGFLADEIFRCGEFHLRSIAFKCRNRQSRPFRQRRVVGKVMTAFARSAPVRVENGVKAE